MKLIAKLIIIAAVFFAGVYVGANQILDPATLFQIGKEEVAEQAVSVMFDFGNGEVKVFDDINVGDDSNVFAVLEKVTTENNIEFLYKDYGSDLGIFVESINNMGNNTSLDRFWQYWVNNQYAKIGASNYKLNPGDVIEWKYTKGQFNN